MFSGICYRIYGVIQLVVVIIFGISKFLFARGSAGFRDEFALNFIFKRRRDVAHYGARVRVLGRRAPIFVYIILLFFIILLINLLAITRFKGAQHFQVCLILVF